MGYLGPVTADDWEALLVVTYPLLDALLVLEERAGAAGSVALVDVAVARVADPESVKAGYGDLRGNPASVGDDERLRAPKLVPAKMLLRYKHGLDWLR